MDPIQESIASYHRLIDGLCALTGIEDPEPLYAHCGLAVDDVTFTFAHAHFVHPDLVVAFVDFGAPPAEKRERVLQRLLESNLFMFCDADSPAFSLNPESGHVLMMTRICLPLVKPEGVLNLMRHLAVQVKTWRKHFFLSDEERSSLSTPRATSSANSAWLQHKLSTAAATLPRKG